MRLARTWTEDDVSHEGTLVGLSARSDRAETCSPPCAMTRAPRAAAAVRTLASKDYRTGIWPHPARGIALDDPGGFNLGAFSTFAEIAPTLKIGF